MEAEAPVTWADVEDALAPYGAVPRNKQIGNRRTWKVPHPAGGTFYVAVTLRPRWCTIDVDRWNTTERDPDIAEAWFRDHVWPAVYRALADHGGPGYLPSGAMCAFAYPIERRDLLPVLRAWAAAERDWAWSKKERV